MNLRELLINTYFLLQTVEIPFGFRLPDDYLQLEIYNAKDLTIFPTCVQNITAVKSAVRVAPSKVRKFI